MWVEDLKVCIAAARRGEKERGAAVKDGEAGRTKERERRTGRG